jgi:hypothetical protein
MVLGVILSVQASPFKKRFKGRFIMMRIFTIVFGLTLVMGLIMTSQLALATEDDGGFGASYFTADTPAALAEPDEMDIWADRLGNIAPAAGGDDPFFDDNIEIEALPDGERLDIPDDVPLLSPGYTAPNN